MERASRLAAGMAFLVLAGVAALGGVSPWQCGVRGLAGAAILYIVLRAAKHVVVHSLLGVFMEMHNGAQSEESTGERTE